MNDKDKIPKRTAPSVKEVGCKSMLAENKMLSEVLSEMLEVTEPGNDAMSRMGTFEGRIKYYRALREVRNKAIELINS